MAAATLSNSAVVATSETTATLTFDSNQATGTVYAVVTASSTTPSHAQIVAGQNNTGGAALWAGSQAGALSNTLSATIPGLSSQLFAHFTQVNGAAENSTPITSPAFFLHNVVCGTLTTNGTSGVVNLVQPFFRVSGTFGSGTATVQYKDPLGNWVALSSAAYTTASQLQSTYPRARQYRIVLTGSTSPSLAWEIS